MKQACGGHGYLQAAGLTKIIMENGVGAVTAEGDPIILLQQTGLYVLKQYQTGKIDPTTLSLDVKSKLDLNKEILLLFEIRFKGELLALSQKI